MANINQTFLDYGGLQEYDTAIKNQCVTINTFTLTSSNWTSNTDPTTSTDYPYIYTISSALYNNSSMPVWDVSGSGTLPTAAERLDIANILEAIFSTSGIVLYATSQPAVNLTLRVKGV